MTTERKYNTSQPSFFLKRYTIRPIQESDNAAMAQIIRDVLINEFNFSPNEPGSSLTDPNLEKLSEYYSKNKRGYFVIVENDKILGGGGFAKKENDPNNVS